MKIKIGKYNQQLSFGITFTNYYNEYRALIIDFGIWYIEFIVGDYSREELRKIIDDKGLNLDQ